MRRDWGILVAFLTLLWLPMGAARADETISYTYDALGRLVAVSSSGTVNNGQAVSTSYDAAGNRTNYTVSGATGDAPIVSIGSASATEGAVLNFTVTLSAASANAISVSYATANGTALAGSDYVSASSSITIPAGQTSATITIATVDDTMAESTETMGITISSPTGGAALGAAAGTGTINDNDGPWSATLTAGYSNYCTASCTNWHGYVSDWAGMGSLSNTSFNGLTVMNIYDINSAKVRVTFGGGSTPPNSGWTSITIPGFGTLNRASAAYLADSWGTGTASWTWQVAGTVATGMVSVQ